MAHIDVEPILRYLLDQLALPLQIHCDVWQKVSCVICDFNEKFHAYSSYTSHTSRVHRYHKLVKPQYFENACSNNENMDVDDTDENGD